jgi:hypothetical protein
VVLSCQGEPAPDALTFANKKERTMPELKSAAELAAVRGSDWYPKLAYANAG